MHQILQKKKKYFNEMEVPYRKITNYQEFSVANVLENGYILKQTIMDYFPSDPYSVDKEWMWRMWFKTSESKATAYLNFIESEK